MSLKGFFRKNMRMVLSETPLKEFGHSDCKTEGWAEQVTEKVLWYPWWIEVSNVVNSFIMRRLCIKLSHYSNLNQVINQWEMTASEVPKKDYKPRTNAVSFCEFIHFIFTLSQNMKLLLIRILIIFILFFRWKRKVCPRDIKLWFWDVWHHKERQSYADSLL